MTKVWICFSWLSISAAGELQYRRWEIFGFFRKL